MFWTLFQGRIEYTTISDPQFDENVMTKVRQLKETLIVTEIQ